MGWFDEQIRQRKEADDAVFEDSFIEIAGAIMGRRLSEALSDERKRTTDAIGEILRFYKVTPKEVPDSVTDTNEILEYLMRPYGIMRRTIRLDKGWYKDAVGALLGTRKEDGELIVLLPSGLSGYKYQDPKTGEYIKINHSNESMLDSEAIAFYKPFPLKKMSIPDLIGYLIDQVSVADIIMLLLTMGVATGVGMIMPMLNAKLFGEVIEARSLSALLAIAIFMISATLSSLLFGVVQSLASERINIKFDVMVEAASMMRVLSLPADFFKDYSAGDLANRVSYMNSLSTQLINMALSTGLSGLFSLAYITQIVHYAPSLVIPSLVVTIVTILVSTSTMLLQTKISKKQMELGAKESGICHALIGGIQKIRLAGAEQRAFAIWGKTYSESASLTYNPPMFLKVSSVINLAVSSIGVLVIYYEAITSGVSVSEYYAFNAAYGMVSAAIMSLAGIATSVAHIKPTLDMVRPILETVPEIDENKTIVTHLSGGIELNNITFRYKEDMPPVLDDLSLKIRPGQYVAIVGKTGCGKSTLMRILLGFESPQKGAVYYDGHDLKSLDPKSLRRRIGTVMQDGKLFMGDIFSNITISAPWLTLKDAWEAAELAGIAEDIKNMPMGMNTLISEGQGGISGGQRQRLMIARAIAPKPKILMFDEATSALDNITQKQVSTSLDQMKCTRVVIAHRLSTIKQCDRIVVLDKGHIIEDGNYDELIANGGYFAELVARQRLDDTEYVGKTTVY